MKHYKQSEIKNHFHTWLQETIEHQGQDWINDNIDDLHHYAFNEDYYIIGTYQAKQWLGDHVFDVIETIKEYEQDNFGQVSTDLSCPEKIVNMYAYIVGEQIVYEYINEKERINNV
tara:strand:- start:238 stop:585 length:348 start_codon:yes stop_codon:yes gene_type:complete